MQDDHHYLNVPRLETFTVSDTLGCNINCLRNPSCLSVNLAATKTAADGKIWCELLSSEKYSNPEKYKRNKTSHHLSSFLKVVYVNSLPVLLNILFCRKCMDDISRYCYFRPLVFTCLAAMEVRVCPASTITLFTAIAEKVLLEYLAKKVINVNLRFCQKNTVCTVCSPHSLHSLHILQSSAQSSQSKQSAVFVVCSRDNKNSS